MLKSLYIKNYALIDSLEIDFESGFSVITGETGAGKSIILGALSLILGQRADTKTLKKDADKCIVEGVFDVEAYDLKAFCEENDIEFDPKTYILRREILSTGKSRAFINDSPATLNDLKALGEQLIDIHSQHENLLLANTDFQLNVVDIIAGNKKILDNYTKQFKIYKSSETALKQLQEQLAKSKEDEEYIRYQYSILDGAKLKADEQEELEEELKVLSHAEEIKSGLYKMHLLLSNDETGIVNNLSDSLKTANSLEGVYPKAKEIAERLESAYIDMKDMSTDMERLADDIEFSKERLDFVQERLNNIYNLQSRYKLGSVAELLTYKDELGDKLSKLDLSDDEINLLKKQLTEQKAEAEKLATELTKSRKKATSIIEKSLVNKITTLGIPNAQLECKLSSKTQMDSKGLDNIEFLFSANKSMPPQPVAQVASGGEISRFMLCLKSIIAGATALPTIIFDEVDTGVSGEISDKMGVIMQEFGTKMQVIAITHQPQIAAKGKVHYKVYKKDEGNVTTTNLIRLTSAQRLDEIAGMLSGSVVTEAAQQNAKVMLGLLLL